MKKSVVLPNKLKQGFLSIFEIPSSRVSNTLKTRTSMNAKISVLAICDEAIIYLLFYNLHGCTFK